MSSTDDLKRFMDDLEASEELRKKLDETVRKIAEAGTVASDGELMIAAAAELGYSVSVADLERATAEAEAEDLDDDELGAVAGGLKPEDEYGHDAWCLTAWHCFTATLHTDSKRKYVSCWSNYECAFVYEHPDGD